MDKMNLDKRSLRNFGITMGTAFLAISLFIFVRHKHNSVPGFIISSIFFMAAFMAPEVLKPVYIIWMKLALILSWINTRIILLIIFYLLFAPVGIILRLLGRDPLDRKIEKNKESYWKKNEKHQFNPLDYERQF